MVQNLYAQVAFHPMKLQVSFEYEAGVIWISNIDRFFRGRWKTIRHWDRHEKELYNLLAPIAQEVSESERENLLEHREWLARI